MVTRTKDMSEQSGRLIRSLRKHAGYTQSELGEKLGVTRQSIHAVEQANRRLTLEHLEEILDALGYRLDVLPKRKQVDDNNTYPVRNVTDVATRTREKPNGESFRLALRELYRYVAHTRDPLSILAEPHPTGTVEKDAYLAGVAESIARYYDWDVPDWTNRDRYVLAEPYFPGAPEGMKIPLLQLSPGPFRVRNIFVDDTAVVGPLEKYEFERAENSFHRG